MSALAERITLLASRDDLVVSVLREVAQLAEGARDRADVREERLRTLEERVERLTLQITAIATLLHTPAVYRSQLHADVLPPPATVRASGHEIGGAMQRAILAAKARHHAPGAWTQPANGCRDRYAACLACGAALTVSAAAAIGGAALEGPCASAPERRAPIPVRAAPRFRARTCMACRQEFQPRGPRAIYCRQPPCASAEG
jgi:hypothetical protein